MAGTARQAVRNNAPSKFFGADRGLAFSPPSQNEGLTKTRDFALQNEYRMLLVLPLWPI
jgi:hypothetical protein